MADIDYKALSKELDQILERLQTAELGIDDAVKDYDRGMKIIQQLETHLKTAENKVLKIKTNFQK